MEILLIFTCLLILSTFISMKLIKRSLIIKNNSFNPLYRTEEFKLLVIKAHQDFLFPKKTYIWIHELNELKPKLKISPKSLTLFLNTLSEESLKKYFNSYDLVLYWHISERKTLQDILEEIHPELYIQGIERLEAKISHQIIESFLSNSNLLLELENFLFYESINQKQTLT